ncbi:MAG: hypothetical protein E6G96_02495 [Alphaproteobacteria bacterium]|nr:MAG: hypothetical protein E6G96_02495 [Alphaproteobacteria bacterium]
MGTVINFRPVACTARRARSIARKSESATVIILPVIRIERYTGESTTTGLDPLSSSGPRRRGRPRANRS